MAPVPTVAAAPLFSGIAVRVVTKKKTDELFLKWLSREETQASLAMRVQLLKGGGAAAHARTHAGTAPRVEEIKRTAGFGRSLSLEGLGVHDVISKSIESVRAGGGIPSSPPKATSPVRHPREADEAGATAKSDALDRVGTFQRSLSEGMLAFQSPRMLLSASYSKDMIEANASGDELAIEIPRFFFPSGDPPPDERLAREEATVQRIFLSKAEITDTVTLSKLAAVVGLSKYMAGCLALRLLGSDPGALDRPVTESLFMRFYESELREADPVARVWAVLMPKDADRDYLEPDDFVPFVQELVLRHPGLKFLEATPEFQQRYVETVVVRMFYGSARGHHTRITRREFRHSDLVPAMLLVDSENDINKLLRYFSYEHFYVIYCSFWAIDTNHDLIIDKDDFLRHENELTYRIIERVFAESGMPFRSGQPGKMTYEDYVWFFLSEIDKTSISAMRYWFRCLDMDGDGALSMYEIEYFYEEQLHRQESLMLEIVPYEDMLCTLIDMVAPRNPNVITLADLRRSKQGPLFFNSLFNLTKLTEMESKPAPLIRMEHAEPDLTDWDRYARVAYERLAMEEEEEEYGDYDDDDDTFEHSWSREAPF